MKMTQVPVKSTPQAPILLNLTMSASLAIRTRWLCSRLLSVLSRNLSPPLPLLLSCAIPVSRLHLSPTVKPSQQRTSKSRPSTQRRRTTTMLKLMTLPSSTSPPFSQDCLLLLQIPMEAASESRVRGCRARLNGMQGILPDGLLGLGLGLSWWR